MKRITLTERRSNPLYNKSLLLHGNGKLLDYDDQETGIKYRYAQYNTRAVKDCPFATDGCKAVCYATKGNHMFPDVVASRERSFMETRKDDFSESIVYTVKVEKLSKRYSDAVMLIRIHESGDFYSLQYLRKWVKIWKELSSDTTTVCVFYTKSFHFFLKLTDGEKETINNGLRNGTISMNLSMDDTATAEQKLAYLEMLKTFPLANTYFCTENTDAVEHDNVCDCADCAKCGACNNGKGKRTVVKIHSASNTDMEVYRKNIRK